MPKYTKKFTPDPWNGEDVSISSGNRVIMDFNRRTICEMLPPEYATDEASVNMKSRLVEEERANEILIRQSPAMFNELELIQQELEDLKSGRLSIFDYDITARINSISTLLSKASTI